MSAKMLSNTHIELWADAGICIPDCAISVSSPTVFSVTVFPPVLGPVISSVVYSFPILMLIGTAVCGSNSGWMAFCKLIIFSLFICGWFELVCFEYFAFANMKSNRMIRLYVFSRSGVISKNSDDSFCNIFSISISSSFFRFCISLFKLLFSFVK